MKPRYIAIALAAVAALWSGFWLAAKGRFVEALSADEALAADLGMRFTYTSRAISGFPFRLIAEYKGPVLSGAGAGFGWGVRADTGYLIAQPWQLRHVVLHAPDAAVVLSADWSGPSGTQREYVSKIKAAGAQASISANAAGGLRRVSVELTGLDGESDMFGLGPFAAADLQLHLRWRRGGTADDQDLVQPLVLEPALRLKELTLKGRDVGALGPTLNRFVLQAGITGEKVPSRSAEAIAAWRQAGGTLDMPLLSLRWGPLEVDGSGTVAVDEDLRPIGAFAMKAHGLDAALATLEADRRLSSDAAELLRITLNLLAGQEGEPTNFPVNLQDGTVYIGPVAIVETGTVAVSPN